MKNLVCLAALLFFYSLIHAQCPTIIFGDAIGAPGDTVSVTLFFDDMPALAGFQGTIEYDPSVATLIDIEHGAILEDDFGISYNEPFGPGRVIIVATDRLVVPLPVITSITEIGRFVFVLNGQIGENSTVQMNNGLVDIQLVNLSGEVSLCDNISGSISISDGPPSSSNFEVGIQTNNALCNLTQLGSISATGFFGTAPYTFSWIGPNGFNATGETIDNLLPGVYNLTATDSDGTTLVFEDLEILEQGGDFEVSPTLTHNFCDEGQNGSIFLNIVNDTGNPLSYSWSNGVTAERLDNLSNGIYTLTITDNLGCTLVNEYEINSTRPIPVLFDTELPCVNDTNGSISTTFNDAFEFDFAWSNGALTSDLSDIGAGVYDVTITEAQGCTQVRTIELTELNENSSLNINATCTSLGLDNGAIGAEFLGDLAGGPVSFLLMDNGGNMLTSPLNLATGSYSITATSVNGCEYSGETVIEESLSDFRESYFSCMLDSIQIETSSNNPDLLYSWSPAERFSLDSIANPIFLTDPTSGSLTSVLTTSAEQGCSRDFFIAVNDIDDCVWPGDTNEDQMVSASDLLNIGLVNGNFGPARPTPGITEWFTQPAILWSENIGTTSLNSMFADCNGDGVIDASDVLAVEQNKGLTHLSFTSEEEVNRNIGTPLFVDLAPNYLDGVEHDINIVLGDTEDPGQNVYGIAFQIKYDPSITTLFEGTFGEQGWMSEDGSTVWDIEFLDAGLGLMDVAITRTNGLDIDGTGPIARFRSSFTPNNKTEIEFEIINAVLITNQGEEMPVDDLLTTSVIGSNSTSSIEASLYNERISPNPTSGVINVQSDREIKSYQIFNTIGQSVLSSVPFQNQINVTNLVPGLYLIHFDGPEGLTSHKLIVK